MNRVEGLTAIYSSAVMLTLAKPMKVFDPVFRLRLLVPLHALPRRWLVSQLDAVFAPLDTRVQLEGAAAKAEELRKKKEREEAGRRMKEERLRRLEEETVAAQAVASFQEQPNALAVLPNQIESPLKPSVGLAAAAATSPGGTNSSPLSGGPQQRDFSDLGGQQSDQGDGVELGAATRSHVARQFGSLSGMPPRPPGDESGRPGPCSAISNGAEDAISSQMSGLTRHSPVGSLAGLPEGQTTGLLQRPSSVEGRRSGNGSLNRVAPEPIFSGGAP